VSHSKALACAAVFLFFCAPLRADDERSPPSKTTSGSPRRPPIHRAKRYPVHQCSPASARFFVRGECPFALARLPTSN
jgi:hypothetical protein